MSKTNVNRTSTPIKWAGGKSWMADEVNEIYQNHREKTFVELFAGGLGVSFAIKPERVLAVDKNFDLIRFYKRLQEKPVFDLEMKNDEETYYQHRQLFNDIRKKFTLENEQLKAELFYYLNRCGYNGLYRVNKKNEFNVPYGKYKYSNAKNDLTEYSEIIKHWEFICGDFERVRLLEDDFLFIDSPYDTEFTAYTDDGFTYDDQVRLQDWLVTKKNPMISTNQATPRMIELYEKYGWNIEYLSRPRNFRRGKDRTEEGKREIFATKNL